MYFCSFFETCIYLLTGIVACMVFPPFVADHGCVSSLLCLSPFAVGNAFRRLSAKFAGYHVFESRQARYGNRQVGLGTKRDAELA